MIFLGLTSRGGRGGVHSVYVSFFFTGKSCARCVHCFRPDPRHRYRRGGRHSPGQRRSVSVWQLRLHRSSVERSLHCFHFRGNYLIIR